MENRVKMGGKRISLLTYLVDYEKAILNGTTATCLKSAVAWRRILKTRVEYNNERILNEFVLVEGVAGAIILPTTCVRLTASARQICAAISIDEEYDTPKQDQRTAATIINSIRSFLLRFQNAYVRMMRRTKEKELDLSSNASQTGSEPSAATMLVM